MAPSKRCETTANDAISEALGDWGRWQLRTVLLIFLCKFPACWCMAIIIFTAPSPRQIPVECMPTPANGRVMAVMHPTLTVPNDQQFDIDYCDVRADVVAHAEARGITLPSRTTRSLDDRNITLPCDALTHRPFYPSKETSFDLLCSRNLVAAFTQVFHLFGVVSGGLIALAIMTLYVKHNIILFSSYRLCVSHFTRLATLITINDDELMIYGRLML